MQYWNYEFATQKGAAMRHHKCVNDHNKCGCPVPTYKNLKLTKNTEQVPV